MNVLFALVILTGGHVFDREPAATPILSGITYNECQQARAVWTIQHPRWTMGQAVCIAIPSRVS